MVAIICLKCNKRIARKSDFARHRKSCMPTPEDKARRFPCLDPACTYGYKPAIQKCNRDSHVKRKHARLWFELIGEWPVIPKRTKKSNAHKVTCLQVHQPTPVYLNFYVSPAWAWLSGNAQL